MSIGNTATDFSDRSDTFIHSDTRAFTCASSFADICIGKTRKHHGLLHLDRKRYENLCAAWYTSKYHLGMGCKTEAQTNDYLQNNITQITLDGKVIEGTMSGGIQKSPTSGLPEVVWFSDMGVLSSGQHTVTYYDVKWKKMIDDGTGTYGPGGKHETEHDECQIIVQ